MEKLAEALPQLQDEDLLQVVQMVHDNKSEETYTKNDVESTLLCPSNFEPRRMGLRVTPLQALFTDS